MCLLLYFKLQIPSFGQSLNIPFSLLADKLIKKVENLEKNAKVYGGEFPSVCLAPAFSIL